MYINTNQTRTLHSTTYTTQKHFYCTPSTIRMMATAFTYHQRSQIVKDTVKPSFLYEKFILKHSC